MAYKSIRTRYKEFVKKGLVFLTLALIAALGALLMVSVRNTLRADSSDGRSDPALTAVPETTSVSTPGENGIIRIDDDSYIIAEPQIPVDFSPVYDHVDDLSELQDEDIDCKIIDAAYDES